MEEIISKIKEKKELAGISDEIVREILEKKIKRYKWDLLTLKKSEIKTIVKEVRAELRLLTGRFQISPEKHLEVAKGNKLEDLLRLHTSTKERLNFYPKLKEEISNLKIKSILDLGCGLNPLALASPGVKYYASDINQSDLNIIQEFFNKNNIQGETFVYDLRNQNKDLPKADLCILFKVLDIIETKGHKLAERILRKLECKYILISFPTKILTSKAMNYPRRGWIERLLQRLGWSFRKIESDNEMFYLVGPLAK